MQWPGAWRGLIRWPIFQNGRPGAGVDVTAYADKPRTGTRCACGRPAWSGHSRCRNCVALERDRAALDGYGPDEMRKDTLLADRARFRMEVERLAERCHSQFVLVKSIELRDD